MKNLNLNLRGKLIVILVTGIVMVFSVIGFYRVYDERINLTEQLNRSGQERALLISDAVASLLVTSDYGNIEAIADRIVKFQDVQKIVFVNPDGKVMVSRVNTEAGTEYKGIGFTAPVIYSGKAIGSVELDISLERFEKSIRAIYFKVLFMIVFTTLFFGLLIYAAVSYFFVIPLMGLNKAAKQLAIGNYSADLPPVTADEMGSLIRNFSSMRESRKLNEARLHAIFDHSPDAFIQLDFNGDISDWNDKAELIWGYAKSEVLGKNFSMVMPDPELGLNQGYRKCYQKSENIIGVIREVVGQRKDGSHFPLELRTSEIYFENDLSFLVSARDITERKDNETKLLNAMNTAESANAAKSVFLSNMSHEIRTPMNSIIGMTSLAFKTHLNAKQHDYLSKIDYAAQHLLKLINEILDLSKIEAYKLELDIRDFNLEDIFENISSQQIHSAMRKGLHLKLDLDSALSMPLQGDPLRLAQVLLNYTSNAIKFTEKGEVAVSAKKLEEDAEGILIRFEVRDTGIGITEKEAEKLFQPFHQADASTTRKYGGTGLGLAISKQLVQLMGGSVGVESQPDLGSTFWFVVRLPRGQLQSEAIKAPPPDLEILKHTSVLLAEDNLFNQQVAVELLREVGCAVTIANNGQEAIDKLINRRFNCVLMDVQMPVMDGLEATRKIRANPLLADTYIIAMTANAGNEDRERCYEAGMNGFISKPVFAEQLYALLAQGVGAAAVNAEQLPAPVAMRTDIQQPPVNIPAPGIIDRSAVMDLSVLGKMVGNDPDKIRKFSLKFLQSAQAGMAEIKQALQQENWGQLAALGHRHKSPARTVGAHGYADLCVLLESFKQGGDAGQAHKIIEQMDELLLQIEKEINRDTV